MKKIFALLFFASIGIGVATAQGKVKYKKKVKEDKEYREDKVSKNQPTKVLEAFRRDYPNATNVVWTKYKGDWTASFGNGIFRSTAVYHANGERRDTRTLITRKDLPGEKTIWDRIFRQDNINPNNIMRIETPSSSDVIIRLLSTTGTTYFYNSKGEVVEYNFEGE